MNLTSILHHHSKSHLQPMEDQSRGTQTVGIQLDTFTTEDTMGSRTKVTNLPGSMTGVTSIPDSKTGVTSIPGSIPGATNLPGSIPRAPILPASSPVPPSLSQPTLSDINQASTGQPLLLPPGSSRVVDPLDPLDPVNPLDPVDPSELARPAEDCPGQADLTDPGWPEPRPSRGSLYLVASLCLAVSLVATGLAYLFLVRPGRCRRQAQANRHKGKARRRGGAESFL